MERTQHSFIRARVLPWLGGCSDESRGSGTDEQTGRAGVASEAVRQAGPRLLNPELESDKGLSGGPGPGSGRPGAELGRAGPPPPSAVPEPNFV